MPAFCVSEGAEMSFSKAVAHLCNVHPCHTLLVVCSLLETDVTSLSLSSSAADNGKDVVT